MTKYLTFLLVFIIGRLQDKIKKEKKTFHTLGTVLKSNRKIEDWDKIDTFTTLLHNRSISCFGTGISMKSGGAKVVLCTQTTPTGMMRSRSNHNCNCNFIVTVTVIDVSLK